MSAEGAMQRWVAEAPASIDLTVAEQDRWAREVATEMLENFPAPRDLERLEQGAVDAPVLVRLAVKLAQSRQRILALRDDFRVSVVFAVYKEHDRLRTKAEHPHGEDFLVRISQKYLPADDTASGFAALIESLDEESWTRLSGNVPVEIAERDPIEFEQYDAVSPHDLRRAAQLVLPGR